ncbi:MAG: YicC family protein [Gammaproteobacteria bacterium GWF2_41_13]|nr:MAG: YicC family protein [Gammaproteobacteria bacterium GWF2_41_13]
MLKSMTGFIKKEFSSENGQLCFEIRSVNHRYLEPSFRLPESFRDLEPLLRDQLSKKIQRGKIDCTLRFTPNESNNTNITVNKKLMDQLILLSHSIADKISTQKQGMINPTDILRVPHVLQVIEQDHHLLKPAVLRLFQEALCDLNLIREKEGAALQKLLQSRLHKMISELKKISSHLPKILAEQKKIMRTRFKELKIELELARLEQEILLFIQKTDVAEEIDRLKFHIDETFQILESKKPCGRRLDFLMQELNREVNTMGSKISHKKVTSQVVELKVLIEQMREQIQNIE